MVAIWAKAMITEGTRLIKCNYVKWMMHGQTLRHTWPQESRKTMKQRKLSVALETDGYLLPWVLFYQKWKWHREYFCTICGGTGL